MIDLYTAATPNGHKVSIALEELGLPYQVHALDLAGGDQKQPWFLAINPNGRIPAIVDRGNGDFAVFESGAILLYLAGRTGRLIPADDKGRSRVVQWLMFQMGGLGPMMGQANVFARYFPERIEPAIERYRRESRRLLEVLDRRLADSEYLAGDYSIADIAHFAWARTHEWPASTLAASAISGAGSTRSPPARRSSAALPCRRATTMRQAGSKRRGSCWSSSLAPCPRGGGWGIRSTHRSPSSPPLDPLPPARGAGKEFR